MAEKIFESFKKAQIILDGIINEANGSTYADPDEVIKYDVDVSGGSVYGMLAEDYVSGLLPYFKKFNLKVVEEKNRWGSSDVMSVKLEGMRKDLGQFLKIYKKMTPHMLMEKGLYFSKFEDERVTAVVVLTDRQIPRRIEDDRQMEEINKKNEELIKQAKEYNVQADPISTFAHVKVGGMDTMRSLMGDEYVDKNYPKTRMVWMRIYGGGKDDWSLRGMVKDIKRFLIEGMKMKEEDVLKIPALKE